MKLVLLETLTLTPGVLKIIRSSLAAGTGIHVQLLFVLGAKQLATLLFLNRVDGHIMTDGTHQTIIQFIYEKVLFGHQDHLTMQL